MTPGRVLREDHEGSVHRVRGFGRRERGVCVIVHRDRISVRSAYPIFPFTRFAALLRVGCSTVRVSLAVQSYIGR